MSEQTDFDSKAQDWDQSKKRLAGISRIAALIKKKTNIHPGMRIVDFGAGTGLLSLEMRSSAQHVFAVDTSQKMLDVLKEKLTAEEIDNVTTLRQDIDHRELPISNIQLIVSSMTLHHLEDPSRTVKKLYDILDDNGQLAIADLEKESNSSAQPPETTRGPSYGRSFVEDLCLKAGFVSASSETVESYTKTVAGGGNEKFSVFLAIANKRDAMDTVE